MIDKNAIREQFRRHERDTGSSEVQIATLTKRIEQLTEHLKANKKDNARWSPTSACAAERPIRPTPRGIPRDASFLLPPHTKTPLYPPPSNPTSWDIPPSRLMRGGICSA